MAPSASSRQLAVCLAALQTCAPGFISHIAHLPRDMAQCLLVLSAQSLTAIRQGRRPLSAHAAPCATSSLEMYQITCMAKARRR